jgi:AcrR family transcriptional regulator|tara:strand:- start:4406 stop:5143 length:738 start_codon:yes stop_codon:yes gene_type:complete
MIANQNQERPIQTQTTRTPPPKMKITIVQTRHEKGNSSKGQETLLKILSAARSVLVDVGYNAFTMRKIAETADMSIGNLSYYYKSKQLLLSDLLDAVIERYLRIFDDITRDKNLTDEQKMKQVICSIILDCERKETTHFFPELWALANHNEEAAAGMDLLYERARSVIDRLIPRLNPSLSQDQCVLISLFISASLEGQAMFVGYNKKGAHHREAMAELAAETFLNVVLDAKPSQETTSASEAVRA